MTRPIDDPENLPAPDPIDDAVNRVMATIDLSGHAALDDHEWHESGCPFCTALDPLLIALNDIDHNDAAERDLIVRAARPLWENGYKAGRYEAAALAASAPDEGPRDSAFTQTLRAYADRAHDNVSYRTLVPEVVLRDAAAVIDDYRARPAAAPALDVERLASAPDEGPMRAAKLGICPVCQNRFRDDGHSFDCP